MVRFLSDRNIHVFKDPCAPGRVDQRKNEPCHVLFPLVGAVQGCLLGLWLVIAAQFDLSVGIRFLWASAIPFLVTGGIHMDGFMDTMDAVHSYGDRTKNWKY